jgi:hypothetical protein
MQELCGFGAKESEEMESGSKSQSVAKGLRYIVLLHIEGIIIVSYL